MTLSRVALPLFGLAALGGGFAVNSGMSHPTNESNKPSLRLDGKTEAALETLHEELQRRFHDRNDVDFGFSRVIRPEARSHMDTPLMGRDRFFGAFNAKPNPNELRLVPAKDGKHAYYEVNDPEVGWTDPQKLRPAMKPENDREKQAIETLRNAKADIAIYTFGLLGQDAVPPRAKGPGYLKQKSAEAPKAESLLKAVQQAWRSGSRDAVVEGPNGWYLMAHRVNANDKTCVSCHAHTRQVFTQGRSLPPSERALYKVGDDLGMVIIAVRPR